jgi:hypothetical protein
MNMKVKKISLFSPESVKCFIDMKILSDEEKAAIVAGGTDGFCYFYCMEYLTSMYGCSEMNSDDYLSAFISTYGPASVFSMSGGNIIFGVSNMSYMTEFALSYFNMSAVNMSNMSAFFYSGESNAIMAFYSTGTAENPQDHAVIIIGYNATTGKYKYKDPTTNNVGEKSASEFRMGMGFTGCQ